MKGSKTKRTYNLSPETVATVKRLVEEEHAAPTQDALVEQAIGEVARRIQDKREEYLWSLAAADPEFLRDVDELESGLAADDADAWPQ